MSVQTLAAKSTIGIKDLVLRPVTKDDSTGVTYGDAIKVLGAIEAPVEPQNADPNVQYADDGEYDVIYTDPEVKVNIDLAALPVEVAASIGGHTINNDGVMEEAATDTPAYFAVGFRSEKSNGKYRYIWMYKCRAQMGNETYHTKEGTDITRQTNQVQFTAVKRNYDQKWRAVGDEDSENFITGATFLDQVYGGNTLPAASGGGE